MNDQLYKLYSEKYKVFAPRIEAYNSKQNDNRKRATNPLLLKVPEDYSNYKNRIMIFGQETSTWGGELRKDQAFANEIEKIVETYNGFYLKGSFKKHPGAFGNEFKRIKREVDKAYDATFIWNNINKIGRVGKGNLQKINEIQFEHFNVVREEIKLLEPTVMIFFTGPNYNHFIEKNIAPFKEEEIVDILTKVKFNGEFENITAFKTYHPNGLYRRSKNKVVIPRLIDEVKKCCK